MRFISKLRTIALGGASIVGLFAAGDASAADYGYGYGYDCGCRGNYDYAYRPNAYAAADAYPTVFAALGCVQSYETGYIVPETVYAPLAACRPLQRVYYGRIVRKRCCF